MNITNLTIINVDKIIKECGTSLQCTYQNLCGSMNVYVHQTLIYLLIFGGVCFVLSLLFNRFLTSILKRYRVSKNTAERLSMRLEGQIIEVFAAVCIFFIVIFLLIIVPACQTVIPLFPPFPLIVWPSPSRITLFEAITKQSPFTLIKSELS
jgi:hypothetical protein